MSRARTLSRLSWWGLVVFIVGLTALSAWSAVVTRNLTENTRRQVALSDGWKQIRFWIAEEETLERKYRIETWTKHREYHATAARLLAKSCQRLRPDSTPEDNRAIDRLLVANGKYVRAMKLLFDAVDRRDPTRAEAIHRAIDPTYDEVEAIVRAHEAKYNRTAYLKLSQLDKMQRTAEQVIPLLAAAGMCVLGLLFFLLRGVQRRMDVAVRAELEVLEAVASRDALTGLGNHRTFQEAIRRDVAKATIGDPLQLAIVDCDDFKSVNDQHGHLHGDAVLQAFGATVRLHELTTYAYRIGGDEFAFLARRSKFVDFIDAMYMLHRAAPGALLGTTISVGIAFSEPGDNAEALHDRADIALYEAKRLGRNTVSVFDGSVGSDHAAAVLHRQAKHHGTRDDAALAIAGSSHGA